jgi:hypothetical protein
MPKTDDTLAAKFGPPPPAALLAPPPPTHVVLIGQLVACTALLLALQPPFVLRQTPGTLPTLCPARVATAALVTVGATYVLHAGGARPADCFRGACEMAWRILR